MKVLHVMAGGEHGGAETMFVDAIVALHEAGVEQQVVTRHSEIRDPVWNRLGIPAHYAAFPSLLGLRTRSVLQRARKAFKPDVTQFWMSRASSYAKPDSSPNIGWFGGDYDLKKYKNCQYYIGVTRDLGRHISEASGKPDAVAVVHTYANIDPDAHPIDRAVFDTPADAPLLLALARLHPKKGLDVLLKALLDIPNAWLWIAGEGPLRNELMEQTAALGLQNRVRFLGWRTDRETLLRTADICVFPSRYEPFGTVMVEAWMTGVPLIAAAAAGPKAYLEPEKNGLLVEIDDVQGLAAAIRRCLAEPELCARLIEGGLRTYQTTFTKEVLARDSIAFYRRVVEQYAASTK
ncbi:Glycosyl transferase [Azospirillaceae bacterium]